MYNSLGLFKELYRNMIEENLPKTERDRLGIFFRFERFPFYKGLCLNKTKYKNMIA
jgi:hypothetical protein